MSTSEKTYAGTIVLIHGLWMTPRSWEQWVAYYEAKGYRVYAPPFPGFEVEVEALRQDPTPIEVLTIGSVADALAEFLKGLDEPPILIGHSFGGTLVQLMLDRGLGKVGVAINSAPTEGVLTAPLSQAKALFPILKNPAMRHKAIGFTPEEFRYAFTNSLDEEAARLAYERYQIAAPGNIVWLGVLANFIPGKQDAAVDYHKPDRAPLLFIAGGTDNIMPPAVNRSNANHYKTGVVEFHEFPGRCHFTCGQEGWEAVADYALEWAVRHAE